MPDEAPKVTSFLTYKDEKGRTVAVPLTTGGREQLTNPKGVIFEETDDCHIDPDVPREISTCAEATVYAEELAGKRDLVNGFYVRSKMRQLRDRYRKEGLSEGIATEMEEVKSKLEPSQKAGE